MDGHLKPGLFSNRDLGFFRMSVPHQFPANSGTCRSGVTTSLGVRRDKGRPSLCSSWTEGQLSQASREQPAHPRPVSPQFHACPVPPAWARPRPPAARTAAVHRPRGPGLPPPTASPRGSPRACGRRRGPGQGRRPGHGAHGLAASPCSPPPPGRESDPFLGEQLLDASPLERSFFSVLFGINSPFSACPPAPSLSPREGEKEKRREGVHCGCDWHLL